MQPLKLVTIILPEGSYCHLPLYAVCLLLHHTAEERIGEVVLSSKLCLLKKTPRKPLVFATLHYLLRLSAQAVAVNQSIQVPNKDKINSK
jgi:hypothetical protein